MLHIIIFALTTFAVIHPDHDKGKLLTTFRSEFVELQPGRNKKHPLEFRFSKSDIKMHRYAICKFEVTQNLWRHVMGKNPSRWQGERNSVEMLSFGEAVEFCDKVTALLREEKLIEGDQFIRLPTEVEWEYAARAGTNTTYSFGDDVKQLPEYAWFTDNAAGNDPAVGEKKPNDWGLYDIHGYLSEWCLATNSKMPVAYIDQAQWKRESKRDTQALRSGSWKDPAKMLTSDARRVIKTTTRDDAIGLRCVLVSKSAE